jgi:hypothetical protein
MLDNLIGPERSISWVLQFWPVLVFSFASAFVAMAVQEHCNKVRYCR